MKQPTYKKILEHPDREEIISKLIIGIPPKDIYDWLKAKYTNVSEAKFVIAEKTIKSFQDNYLDIYNMIRSDLSNTKAAVASNTEEQLELAVQNNITYKSKMLELANKELNIREMVTRLCAIIEIRFAQVFDEIQENPRDINTRVDRMLKEYGELLGSLLEKYYKFTEEPSGQVIQHNVTLQVVDQHISVFYDVIKEVLSHMDLETSLYFMDVFNEKMSKLKPPTEKDFPNTDIRLAEAKLLSETINKKLNE